jgi:hypothetical protein
VASYTVALGERGVHKTLVASTVDTVTFSKDCDRVEIVNRDGAAELYFTTDGTSPTVGGNNALVLPAAMGSYVTTAVGGLSVVKLISSGTPAYSVLEVI